MEMSKAAYAASSALPAEDRIAYRDLLSQLRETDFNYPFSDSPDVRDEGRAGTERAQASFVAFAAKSRVHAALASEAWKAATDLFRPPAGYVTEHASVIEAAAA